MPVYLNRCFTTCLQADSTVAPPIASLHFQVRFGMERRARPPPIRLHLLPAVRTGCLLLPPSPCCNKSSPGSSLGSSPFNSRRRGAALPAISTRSAADALPPHAHISSNISSAPRTNFAFGSFRFIARLLGYSHPILLVYPLSSTQRFGMHHTTGGITQTYVPELLQEAWPLALHRHLESLVVTEYSGGCPARGPHNSSRRVNKTARNCRYTRGRTQERVLSDAVENETAYWPFLQNPRAPSLVENGPVFRPLSAGSVELSHPRRVIASSVTSEAMCAEYLTRYAQLLQTSFSAAKFAQLRNIITYGKPRAVAGAVGPHKRMTGTRCK